MPIWEWILIAVGIVVVVAALIVAAAVISSRRKTERLKQHYGREYELLVSQTGSEKAAEQELTTRQRKRDKLDIVPLTPSALSDFTTRWHEVQTRFVDDPATAVGVADRLVTEVMRERGYPVDDFDRRAADISVDHPQVVENYRAAHGIHLSGDRGDVSTEQQREAFVHYRALFGKLLETKNNRDASQEASA
jgi:type II secretory pathway pseudopilin PulG